MRSKQTLLLTQLDETGREAELAYPWVTGDEKQINERVPVFELTNFIFQVLTQQETREQLLRQLHCHVFHNIIRVI